VKSSKLAWVGHARRANGILVEMVLVNRTDRKRPKMRLDTVKEDLMEVKPDRNGSGSFKKSVVSINLKNK